MKEIGPKGGVSGAPLGSANGNYRGDLAPFLWKVQYFIAISVSEEFLVWTCDDICDWQIEQGPFGATNWRSTTLPAPECGHNFSHHNYNSFFKLDGLKVHLKIQTLNDTQRLQTCKFFLLEKHEKFTICGELLVLNTDLRILHQRTSGAVYSMKLEAGYSSTKRYSWPINSL